MATSKRAAKVYAKAMAGGPISDIDREMVAIIENRFGKRGRPPKGPLQKAYDDFVAAARYEVRRAYDVPQKDALKQVAAELNIEEAEIWRRRGRVMKKFPNLREDLRAILSALNRRNTADPSARLAWAMTDALNRGFADGLYDALGAHRLIDDIPGNMTSIDSLRQSVAKAVTAILAKPPGQLVSAISTRDGRVTTCYQLAREITVEIVLGGAAERAATIK